MAGELKRLLPAPENLKPSVAVLSPSPVAEPAKAVKLKAPEVALDPKMGAFAEMEDSGAEVASLLLDCGEVMGEAPKTIPFEEFCVTGLPKRPVEVVESAGFEKMFDASVLAGVEKMEEEEASVFTVEKMEEGEEALEEGEKIEEAGAEKRLPAGLKGDEEEEPKREELGAAAPPKTEPPAGFEAPPNIEVVLELEELGVKENAALAVVEA